MALRKFRPYRFNPRSVVDALDGGQVEPGGMAAATNLIFDPANPFTFECRPAAVEEFDFTGITTPDFVSVSYVIGDVCYGMIKSADVPGYDYPFAYNLASNTLLTVSGTKNNTTLPVSQSNSGTWTPPTMALMGVFLIVTHPGFPGGSGPFFGWFNTTNPAAPSWNAGNTTGTALAAVPTAVAQFNNRAWFSHGNNVVFTDALTLNVTSATQVLTIGDTVKITALAPQAITTAVQGILQSLVVFKPDVFAIITGDAAFGNLAINLDDSIGCSAPRTIASTSRGLKFVAKDGVRTLGKDGTASDPDPNIQIPFIYALTPSRASAAYNNNIYRVSVQNGHANGNPIEEYWYDERRNGWTGPHTFTQDMANAYGETFVCFSSSRAPALFISDVVQSGNSTFTEDGEAMAFLYQTTPMPDDGGLYENSATLCVIDMSMPNNGDSYNFAASDVNNGVRATAQVTSPATAPIWGSIIWGAFVWAAASYGLDRYNIPWNNNIVFSRLVLQATGASSYGLKIGKLSVAYQGLGYVKTPL